MRTNQGVRKNLNKCGLGKRDCQRFAGQTRERKTRQHQDGGFKRKSKSVLSDGRDSLI